MMQMRRALACLTLLLALVWLPGCKRDQAQMRESGGERPVEAVSQLNAHLIDNDLAGFARAALPPALHARLTKAWQAGHTRWPLDEFPFASHYPAALAALSADDAQAQLLAVFDQELAGAEHDLKQAALLFSMFMVQLIQQQGEDTYSENERAHYSQLLTAAGQWASTVPLADRARAEQVLELMIPAVREANLTSDAAFTDDGMDAALQRMSALMAAFKQSLALYGLDLDALLAGMQLQVLTRAGDAAQVQMRYQLGGHEVTASVEVVQMDGRWYVRDFVRRATSVAASMEVEMGPPTS